MYFPNYIEGLQRIYNRGLLWINVEKPTSEKMAIVARQFPIHELNVEDCLTKNQLPKIDRYDDHIFVIIQFPTTTRDKTSPNFSQLALFIGKDFLTSISHGNLHPLTDLFKTCKNADETIRNDLMGRSP